MYAAVHLLIYIGLDYGFDFELILQAFRDGRLVWVGLGSFLILVPLAATSTAGWMKRLGKNWKRLHRLVYLSAGLAVLHYSWRFKELRAIPLLVGAMLVLLLIVRLPIVDPVLTAWRSTRQQG
jgi:sulfoxide reductase heme-binding subunit YedZ